MARARIGCAGWSIPAQHRALFDDEGSHLARYARRFEVVEINSSFHRPHAAATYARWAAQVPRGFRFSVKLPKSITHDARLQGAGGLMDRFVGEVAGLGTRLGGILVQLPPSLAYDARVATVFFSMLRRRFPSTGLACEPRHPGWFEPRVDGLWQRHGVARVAADPARIPEAAIPGGDGKWVYWRWHGSPRMYYDAYGPEGVRALAASLRECARAGKQAWCIFDNTAAGHAIADAACLRALLRQGQSSAASTR